MDRAQQVLLYHLLNEDPGIELATVCDLYIRFYRNGVEVRVDDARDVFYVHFWAGKLYESAQIEVARRFPKDADLQKLAQTILEITDELTSAVKQLKENLPEGLP